MGARTGNGRVHDQSERIEGRTKIRQPQKATQWRRYRAPVFVF